MHNMVYKYNWMKMNKREAVYEYGIQCKLVENV